jgi:hypothetical protein
MIEDVFTREERNDAARRLVALVLEQPTDWRAASACTTLLGLAAGDWAAAGIGGLRGRIVGKLVAFAARDTEWRNVDACGVLLRLPDADWRALAAAAGVGPDDGFPADARRRLTRHLVEIAETGRRPSLRARAARILSAASGCARDRTPPAPGPAGPRAPRRRER